MTATEQLWFAIGTGGFMVFLEGAITWLTKHLFKGRISDEIGKVVAGVVIYAIALIYLFNLPAAK